MIITEVMAPQVPDINDKTWEVAGAPDLSLRLKFSEIVLYKFTLALVDFLFLLFYLFIFSRDFCQSLAIFTIYYSKKTQRNFVAYV